MVTGYTIFDLLLMSIKKITLLVSLVLFAYAGGYVAVYGVINFSLYSTTERTFYNQSSEELQSNLNIKGSIETVTKLIGKKSVSMNFGGVNINTRKIRYFYAMPISYSEDPAGQKYCVIATSDPKDIKVLEKLMKGKPVPLDPNAPRFEFRGIVSDMSQDVRQKLTEYLWEVYDTDFDVYRHHNIKKNLVPYTIYVKGSNSDSGLLVPIIAGGAVLLISIALFILILVLTHRKNHMYD